MKVAFYGNVCNNFYTLAKALRQELNIDAHLYLNLKADIQNRPESDDPELKDNYPNWIHISKHWDYKPFLSKLDRTFIKELNQYDIVFLSQMGVTLAPFVKAKVLFYVTGGDLTQIPFPKKFSKKFKTVGERLIWEYIGFMQRRGIRHSTKILSQPFFPFSNALRQLKIPAEKVSNCYFPILFDTKIIKENNEASRELDSDNMNLLSPFDFIIFHPSRIIIDQSKPFVDSGQWKGNDKLFEAFAIFIKKNNIEKACIAMPDRIYSPDIEKAKKIISDLGIQDNVVWLKPPTEQGFPRKELLNFYSIADLVADEFATGWFGSIVIEGMACSKPTLCYVDERVMKQLYPWHPIISANDPASIAELIAKFYFNKELKIQHGLLSRQWVEKFHSISQGTSIYLDNFKKDLSEIFQLS